MASRSEALEQPERQLWDEIDHVPAGMLGVEGKGHMQPMAAQVDAATNTIWFFTKIDAPIVAHVGSGARAHFCVVGKNHDYHACLGGRLTVEPAAREKIDEYWNAVVAAWYENGKEDPKLTMLALRLDDAEIWASTGSAMKFGWEIAKANYDAEKMPDVGVKREIRFN
jgi:Uncharacterized stress protein (general stress protein 26)